VLLFEIIQELSYLPLLFSIFLYLFYLLSVSGVLGVILYLIGGENIYYWTYLRKHIRAYSWWNVLFALRRLIFICLD